MDNYINYYYKLYPNKIENTDNKYFFKDGQDRYYFVLYERNVEEIKPIYELNQQMIKENSLVHEIILNKDNNIITLVDDKPYMLFRIYINENKKVDLSDVLFMIENSHILSNSILSRMNWSKLWETKVDYFEYQIVHIARKYKMLYKTLDYYIGLAENAISYVKEIELEANSKVQVPITISHKRIYTNYTLFDLYNPINFVIDYKVRDISEYIKMSFFENKNIWKEIKHIFSVYNFSPYSLKLLYARLLYPSYYFDIYDEIIEKDLDENLIVNIIEKSKKYEDFLKKIYNFINSYTSIPAINWITKKSS